MSWLEELHLVSICCSEIERPPVTMTMTMAALKEERQAKYKVRQEGIGRQLD